MGEGLCDPAVSKSHALIPHLGMYLSGAFSVQESGWEHGGGHTERAHTLVSHSLPTQWPGDLHAVGSHDIMEGWL